MAEYIITIEGDELEELQNIIAAIKIEQPHSIVTEEHYVEQLVLGPLRQRVVSAYVGAIATKTPAELKNLLGSRKDL